jgi:hypothetical protein
VTTYRAVWLRDGEKHKNFDTYEDALDFLNEVCRAPPGGQASPVM